MSSKSIASAPVVRNRVLVYSVKRERALVKLVSCGAIKATSLSCPFLDHDGREMKMRLVSVNGTELLGAAGAGAIHGPPLPGGNHSSWSHVSVIIIPQHQMGPANLPKLLEKAPQTLQSV